MVLSQTSGGPARVKARRPFIFAHHARKRTKTSRVVVHQPATARVPELSQGSVLRPVIANMDRITNNMVPHHTLYGNVKKRRRPGAVECPNPWSLLFREGE